IGLPVEFSCRPGAHSRRSTTGGRCEIHSAPPRKGALADHPALASPKTITGNPRKPRTEGKPAARRHVSAELPVTQATRPTSLHEGTPKLVWGRRSRGCQ